MQRTTSDKFFFKPSDDISEYGMAISTEGGIYQPGGPIDVKEIPLEFLEKNIGIISVSFGQGTTLESTNTIIQMAKLLNTTERHRDQITAYLAVEKDSGKNAGFSMIEMDTEGKYAILGGAAVLPTYRGRGIYRKMISKRRDDVRKYGIEYLIIRAMKNTSAPVCEEVGFRKVCENNFYPYRVEQ